MYPPNYKPPKRVSDIRPAGGFQSSPAFDNTPLHPEEPRLEPRHYQEFPVYVEEESLPEKPTKKQGKGFSLFVRLLLFLGVLFAVFLLGWFTVEKGKLLQKKVEEKGALGYSNLSAALDNLEQSRFEGSLEYFHLAEQAFTEADKELVLWNGTLVDIVRFVPGLSRAASGKYILEAGEHLARAGVPLAEIAKSIDASKGAYGQGEKVSLLVFLTML